MIPSICLENCVPASVRESRVQERPRYSTHVPLFDTKKPLIESRSERIEFEMHQTASVHTIPRAYGHLER